MLRKSLLVTLTSLVVILGVACLKISLNRSAHDDGYAAYIIVYGILGLSLPIFSAVFIINLVIEKKNLYSRKPLFLFHLAYFMGISILIVLGFSIFDYIGRGRYFDEPGFFDFVLQYLSTFIISIPVMLINLVFFWRHLKKPTQ
jgi:hypothetical protein